MRIGQGMNDSLCLGRHSPAKSKHSQAERCAVDRAGTEQGLPLKLSLVTQAQSALRRL
jgi:hypothetical protein